MWRVRTEQKQAGQAGNQGKYQRELHQKQYVKDPAVSQTERTTKSSMLAVTHVSNITDTGILGSSRTWFFETRQQDVNI